MTARVVVSDTTCLHYLFLIGEIDLLEKLYGSIDVPESMIAELSAQAAPPSLRSWITSLPSWVHAVKDMLPAALLFPSLGIGERQAIARAARKPGSILLTDDLKARSAAESLGIQVVPTIRILSTASAWALVDFEDALVRLRDTNFRVSEKVVNYIRQNQSVKSE